jgi:hypothetical protein
MTRTNTHDQIAALEKRIADLEIAHAAAGEKFSGLQSRVLGQMTADIATLQKDVLPICPDHLLDMEGRHDTLAEQFHLLIHKMTVLTEVAFMLRRANLAIKKREQIMQAMLYCVDLPDDFWVDRGLSGLSVTDWADRCLQEARRVRLSVAGEEMRS